MVFIGKQWASISAFFFILFTAICPQGVTASVIPMTKSYVYYDTETQLVWLTDMEKLSMALNHSYLLDESINPYMSQFVNIDINNDGHQDRLFWHVATAEEANVFMSRGLGDTFNPILTFWSEGYFSYLKGYFQPKEDASGWGGYYINNINGYGIHWQDYWYSLTFNPNDRNTFEYIGGTYYPDPNNFYNDFFKHGIMILANATVEFGQAPPPLPAAVPEPTTLILFGLGILSFAGLCRKEALKKLDKSFNGLVLHQQII